MKKTIQQRLASLAQADCVVIVTSPRASSVAARVTCRDPARIRSLLELLEPSEQSPSGGMLAANLGIHRGGERLADLWVYVNGDWGFTGGGGTVGKSRPLVDVIREQVARGSDTIEAD